MFTRIVHVTAKTGKGRELTTLANEKILPILQSTPGFVDEIGLVSTDNPDRLVAISFWNSKEDAERYQREHFNKVNDLLKNVIVSPPVIETYAVDTSTVHKIAAGKAA